MQRSTPLTLLLAATLLATAAPGALAGSHAGTAADAPGADATPDHAQQWLALKDQLKAGNVSAARAHFDATFAPTATAHHALAGDYATVAFDALAANGDTTSAAWAAWSQVVDKSTYAIAYAAIEHALAEGDVENATAWFGLLEAKFSKAGELPESKRVFANLTADLAVTAGATLARELTDLMQYKVHKEAAEVPGLLVADPVTAAKEAGEALGYFLTIERAYRATFGDDATATALHALEDLVEETLEGAEDEVEHYSLEVRNIAARHAVQTAAREKVDAFTVVKDALKKDEDVETARAVYEESFAHAAEETDPETHERILNALKFTEAAISANDTLGASLMRQVAEKLLYKVAFDAFEHEALEGETDNALAYFGILAAKFAWDAETPGYLAAGRLAAANGVNDADIAAAKAEAYATFFGKVRAEVEEVFMHWDDNPKAQNKAIEGVLYYAPLKADVAARLGDAVADKLERELDGLFDATAARDRETAEHVADEIEKILFAYEAGGKEASPLEQVVSKIKGRVNMIAVEFREREAYLAAGDEKTAAEEVEEAKAFLAGARQEFENNLAAFETAAGADFVADVNARLDHLGELINAEESYETIHVETSALISVLEAATASAPADEPRETFGDAKLLLEAPTLVEPGVYAVRLVAQDFPQDGVAYQFGLQVPEGVKLTDVRLELKEASAIDVAKDGRSVRFNGAATKSLADGETFGEIVFTLAPGAPESAEFAFTVEEFADAAGKPWGVTFEGTTVNLNAVLTDADAGNAGNAADVAGEPAGNATPAPGFALALLALAGLATATRRREV